MYIMLPRSSEVQSTVYHGYLYIYNFLLQFQQETHVEYYTRNVCYSLFNYIMIVLLLSVRDRARLIPPSNYNSFSLKAFTTSFVKLWPYVKQFYIIRAKTRYVKYGKYYGK